MDLTNLMNEKGTTAELSLSDFPPELNNFLMNSPKGLDSSLDMGAPHFVPSVLKRDLELAPNDNDDDEDEEEYSEESEEISESQSSSQTIPSPSQGFRRESQGVYDPSSDLDSSHMYSNVFKGEPTFDIASKNHDFSQEGAYLQQSSDLLRQRMKPLPSQSTVTDPALPSLSTFKSLPSQTQPTTPSVAKVLVPSTDSGKKNTSFAGSNLFGKAIENSRSFGDVSLSSYNKEAMYNQENIAPKLDNSRGSDIIDLTSSPASPDAEFKLLKEESSVHFLPASSQSQSFQNEDSSELHEESSEFQESSSQEVEQKKVEEQPYQPRLSSAEPNQATLVQKMSVKEPVLQSLQPAVQINEAPCADEIHRVHLHSKPAAKQVVPTQKEEAKEEPAQRVHLHASKPTKESTASARKPGENTMSLVVHGQPKSPELEVHPDMIRRALSTKKMSEVRKLAFLQQAQKLNKPLNAGVSFSPIKTVKEYKVGSSPSKPAAHHRVPISKEKEIDQWEDYRDDSESASPSPSPTPYRYKRDSSYYSTKSPFASSTPLSARGREYRSSDYSLSESSFASSFNAEWVDVDNQYEGNYSRRPSNASKSKGFHSEEKTAPEEPEVNNTVFKTRGFHNDPSVPYTLSLYLQLLLNFVLSCIFIYFFYILITTIRHDVDKKVEEYSAEILAEMAECSKQYLRNNCMPGRRVPALENTCISWERCMNRDPTVVGRARVSAETFSEIINSFIKPLTLKTWTVIGGFMIASFVFSNAAFAVFRSNQHSYFHGQPGAANAGAGPPPPPPPPPGFNQQPFTPGYPPATPYGYYTPMLKITTGRRRHKRTYSPSEAHSQRKRSHRS